MYSVMKVAVSCRTELHVEDPVHASVARLQQGDSHVIDGNATGRASLVRAMMCVSVDYEISAVAIDDLRQSRGAEEGKNLRVFALHRGDNRSVVQHDNP